ncbi:hypothetical protein SNEBB_004027 [Seison nebaliae]|nr:hypothetical protein SNEBB_004027 [Seison nebaliae]
MTKIFLFLILCVSFEHYRCLDEIIVTVGDDTSQVVIKTNDSPDQTFTINNSDVDQEISNIEYNNEQCIIPTTGSPTTDEATTTASTTTTEEATTTTEEATTTTEEATTTTEETTTTVEETNIVTTEDCSVITIDDSITTESPTTEAATTEADTEATTTTNDESGSTGSEATAISNEEITPSVFVPPKKGEAHFVLNKALCTVRRQKTVDGSNTPVVEVLPNMTCNSDSLDTNDVQVILYERTEKVKKHIEELQKETEKIIQQILIKYKTEIETSSSLGYVAYIVLGTILFTIVLMDVNFAAVEFFIKKMKNALSVTKSTSSSPMSNSQGKAPEKMESVNQSFKDVNQDLLKMEMNMFKNLAKA